MDLNLSDKYTELSKLSSITHALLLVIFTSLVWYVMHSVSKWWQYRKKLPPGPTGVPLLGNLPFLGSEPHKTIHEMRKKYGDIIGLYFGKKYTVVLNEYSVMKDVMSHPAALDRAPELFDHIPRFGFAIENGENWQEQRRFSMAATRDLGLGKMHWEEMIKDEANSFVEFLKKTDGKPTDITQALKMSISSNIISFLIGRKLDKVKEADKIQLSLDFNHHAFTRMGIGRAISYIPGLRQLLQYFGIADYDRAARVMQQFTTFIRNEILGHKNDSKRQGIRDFVSIYLEELNRLQNSSRTKHSFSEAMLEGNSVALFAGASDTIFASLGWLLRIMTDRKDIQDKVYKELMENLGKEQKARYEERDKIPYTFAVILEVMRFVTVAPFVASRKATQDIQVKGFTLPKGVEITANIWAVHHDEKYFDEPHKLKPERFLTDNGTKLVKNPPGFASFSMGRRMCPGETVAYMEILTYFSEIIKNFEVSTEPGVKTDFTYFSGLVSVLVPQPLCFKERRHKN